MKGFSLFFASVLVLILSGCNDSNKTPNTSAQNETICPQCHMEVDSSKEYSSKLNTKDEKYVFDDIGCMILFAQKKEIDFSLDRSEVFTKDTQRFLPIYKARYKMHEKTPMKYGFVAYESRDDTMIVFDELRLKMLRGEHMANPKIRKKVLGV